ncbi:hypothetical protein FS749_001365, partial [Ceratobasidium sp. UAMH 11750]
YNVIAVPTVVFVKERVVVEVVKGADVVAVTSNVEKHASSKPAPQKIEEKPTRAWPHLNLWAILLVYYRLAQEYFWSMRILDKIRSHS